MSGCDRSFLVLHVTLKECVPALLRFLWLSDHSFV